MGAEQLRLAPNCVRCGRPLHDDREIGILAEDALSEIKNRKLFVPDSATGAIRAIADEMWCRIGVCRSLG